MKRSVGGALRGAKQFSVHPFGFVHFFIPLLMCNSVSPVPRQEKALKITFSFPFFP
jgi:hypothetical protein